MSEHASETGRALVALRQKVPRTCVVCSKTFEGFSHQKYCGRECQQAAYREAHRDELNTKRRAKYHRQKAAKETS